MNGVLRREGSFGRNVRMLGNRLFGVRGSFGLSASSNRRFVHLDATDMLAPVRGSFATVIIHVPKSTMP